MKEIKKKSLLLKTVPVFILTFLVVNCFAHLQLTYHKKQEKFKASFTAEEAAGRVESQLNRYLAKADLIRKIIESGAEISEEEFSQLASFMQDSHVAINAIGLARDGKVSEVWPAEENAEALGMDMLEAEDRKEIAMRAKESGSYALAGPFELIQGGVGALLFDPIYQSKDGENAFWGFVILVIDWDGFCESLELDKLEAASYQYQVWKKEVGTGEKIILLGSETFSAKDVLEVSCEVPNDMWYFSIAPQNGWYSREQLLFNTSLSVCIALLISLIVWQYKMRRSKEEIYLDEIRKTAEKARAASAAKTNFLSRMSHDIRTPLNGIIGLLHIDEQNPDDDQLIRENRSKMLIAANHLLSLINDVLQMSKLESGELVLSRDVIDLAQMTEDILTLVEERAAEAGVTLEYDRDSDDTNGRKVYGSALHIRQLFLNIYGNCIKYNRVGGTVRGKFCNLGEENGMVKYRWIISDTGIGMSEEFLKHIFEPFAQEHSDARSIYQGTGLGMAIVKGLIDAMDGTIEIESKEGVGSTFTITLPFELAENEVQEECEIQEENPDISGLHLLLAEDNELNAEIAQMLLRNEGAEVTVAEDGQAALDLFADQPPGTFDAILMDIMMPYMDGFSATRAIRALPREDAKSIPILAMTANAFEEDAKRCLEAGMNAHLSKPLQMENVTETLARYCKRK